MAFLKFGENIIINERDITSIEIQKHMEDITIQMSGGSFYTFDKETNLQGYEEVSFYLKFMEEAGLIVPISKLMEKREAIMGALEGVKTNPKLVSLEEIKAKLVEKLAQKQQSEN